MIIIAGLLVGAAWGALSARKRGGNRLDMLQYATVGAIIGGLAGLIATIAVQQMV